MVWQKPVDSDTEQLGKDLIHFHKEFRAFWKERNQYFNFSTPAI
jgi:hypothetical protein